MMRRGNALLSRPDVTVTDGLGPGDDEWDHFVVANGARLSQSTAWALARAPRWSASRVVIQRENEVVAGVQVMIRSLGLLGRVGYIDGGPIVRPGPAEATDAAVLADELKRLSRRRHLRLLIADPFAGSPEVPPALRAAGFNSSRVKTGLNASVRIDLTRSLGEILAEMRTNTRRNIRKAEKSGVAVRIGDRSDIEILSGLVESTSERQHFSAPDRSYFTRLFDRLAPEGKCAVFISEVENRPVAAVFAIVHRDTVVFKRGGWNGQHADVRPNEILHWHVINWAKERGLRFYDFDGIEPDIARRLLAGESVEGVGVTRFKLGFGGEVFLLPETVSYVPNRVLRVAHDRVLPRISRLGPTKRALRKLRAG